MNARLQFRHLHQISVVAMAGTPPRPAVEVQSPAPNNPTLRRVEVFGTFHCGVSAVPRRGRLTVIRIVISLAAYEAIVASLRQGREARLPERGEARVRLWACGLTHALLRRCAWRAGLVKGTAR